MHAFPHTAGAVEVVGATGHGSPARPVGPGLPALALDPTRPAALPVGSPEKVELMRRRVEAGLPPCLPGDRPGPRVWSPRTLDAALLDGLGPASLADLAAAKPTPNGIRVLSRLLRADDYTAHLTLIAYRRRHGLRIGHGPQAKELPPDIAAAVLDALANGTTTRRLAAQLGVCQATARNYIIRVRRRHRVATTA